MIHILVCNMRDEVVTVVTSISTAVAHYAVTYFQEYANIGLRTLSLAYKELDPIVYDSWKEEHYKASISLTDRDDKLHDIYEKIEVSFTRELR